MAERKITVEDAAIFRIQALLETMLRMQAEMMAHLANKNVKDVLTHVLKEVDVATKELISMHSYLRNNPSEN